MKYEDRIKCVKSIKMRAVEPDMSELPPRVQRIMSMFFKPDSIFSLTYKDIKNKRWFEFYFGDNDTLLLPDPDYMPEDLPSLEFYMGAILQIMFSIDPENTIFVTNSDGYLYFDFNERNVQAYEFLDEDLYDFTPLFTLVMNGEAVFEYYPLQTNFDY